MADDTSSRRRCRPRSELASAEGPRRPLASRARALVPPCPQLDRAVGDGHPEGRPDGALDQSDLAAMSAHQLGRDRKAKAGATRAVRALERLEQMRARLRG